MCERILRHTSPGYAIALEEVLHSDLARTAPSVLAALAWAYREIERLEAQPAEKFFKERGL